LSVTVKSLSLKNRSRLFSYICINVFLSFRKPGCTIHASVKRFVNDFRSLSSCLIDAGHICTGGKQFYGRNDMKTNRFRYEKSKLGQISFPLGGIGSGCVGLSGTGRLIDWEIFNRPNKGGLNGFSHFAVKAEAGGRVLDARILNGDLPPPYIGSFSRAGNNGYGFGPDRETLAGLPHFVNTSFEGRYPFANVGFQDKAFPGKISLQAFNPFIPLNDKDSSIPAAFFEFTVTNTTRQTVTYTIAGTLGSLVRGKTSHEAMKAGVVNSVHIKAAEWKETEPQYGDLTIATDAETISHQEYWFRGSWFDSLEIYWRDLTKPGAFENRHYSEPGRGGNGLLAAHIRLKPGQTRKVRFVISWNFPVCENYWEGEKAKELIEKSGLSPTWRNYYAKLWKDSMASAQYSLLNWDRLRAQTDLFHGALFSSSVPDAVLDAVSANISTLKSPTVLRLEDGTLYGFEGCCHDSGCCPGSCTHVWNYAQAHAFLFPSLARSMRDVDYKYNQQADGGMPFRIRLPLGLKHGGGFSCADGLFGNVMLVYRDWKISGDTDWLKSLWPFVKKSIEFAWASTNAHRWDPEKTGVLWGRQHHTLDMELYGPSSWLCGFYMGALKAASEMAGHLGETDTSREYAALFARGKKWVESHLFNGEYYQQKVNIKDRCIPKSFDAEAAYWDAEHGEIKYQIDEGCAIDQTLAQYHATLYGLGELFDPRRNRRAMKALFRNNFHSSMRNVYNPCRLYAINDEGGMAICSWPAGKRKPAIPLTYAQEAMHGFEYAAAVQLIQNGLVKEGLAVVESIRDRYDGERRNPWNEIECGSHYARSMASYGLLNAMSGFEFDMARGHIGFRPVQMRDGRFKCFWSLGSGWGDVDISKNGLSLRVLNGTLTLKSIGLNFRKAGPGLSVALAGKRVAAERDGDVIRFKTPVVIPAGCVLRVTGNGAARLK
jgi:non-lysosomal glucosylceramidase